MIIMNKVGEIVIKDNTGVEKERYPAIYGAKIFFKEGDEVNVGDKIIEWDPFSIPILTEVEGTLSLKTSLLVQTLTEAVDPVTGLTHKSCI